MFEFINPRHACAARVIVLGSCVCVSVKSHLTSRMNNRAINKRAYSVACERQKNYEDLLHSRVMPRNTREKASLLAYPWSAFSAQCTAKHQRLPTSIYQRHSALPQKMPTDAASPCWSEN